MKHVDSGSIRHKSVSKGDRKPTMAVAALSQTSAEYAHGEDTPHLNLLDGMLLVP